MITGMLSDANVNSVTSRRPAITKRPTNASRRNGSSRTRRKRFIQHSSRAICCVDCSRREQECVGLPCDCTTSVSRSGQPARLHATRVNDGHQANSGVR